MISFVDSRRLSSRVAVGSLFFIHGLCCASWASRIPTIQTTLHLSEAALGSVLFALPVGSLLSMPIAAWLTSRLGSQRGAGLALTCYAICLVNIALAPSILLLVLALVLFGMSSNLVNIAINTQAIELEVMLKRNLMSSIHGLWSLAGFVGAALGTIMMAFHLSPLWHFSLVFVVIMGGLFLSYRSLLPDRATTNHSFFAWPDRRLLALGLIAFCSMLCEGAMFDWSGVYFQNVIMTTPALIGAGYVSFMATMAGTRLLGDFLIHRYGNRVILEISGIGIVLGLGLSILLPYFWFSIIGFLLVGAGTALVVPLVYSEAGKSSSHAASHAVTAISTIGFLGFLIGPPLIGWIAEWTSLRLSFALIALMGFGIFFLARGQNSTHFPSSP